MPIIFVHGVSNRKEDRGYLQGQQVRQRMVEQIVGPALSQFPNMGQLKEVYWGDLGVKFRWNMNSLPTEITHETVGGELAEATGMAALLSNQPVADGESVHESPADKFSPLVAAARNSPADLIEQLAYILSDGLKETQSLQDRRIDPTFSDMTMLDGADVADLIINAHQASRDSHFLQGLQGCQTDEEVMRFIEDRITGTSLGDGYEDVNENVLGNSISSGWSWLSGKVNQANSWVQDQWSSTKEHGSRAASVMLLRSYREQLSKGSFLFFGDIFEYIKRGQGSNGKIKNRVRDQLKQFAAVNRMTDEPLVVISHSFGGEVVYDLLTSGELDDIKIDLWVTVGSQVALFAEMAIFDTSPEEKPASGHLPKPEGVEKWINVYDTVDVFSFLCEPVFGNSTVSDIKLGTGNVKSAHGAYFTNPEFYEIILASL